MLFSPLQIRNIILKNRIVVSPMCQYSSVDGFANDWHLVHLGSRAVGGAGLVFTEATSVTPEGRITPDDLGIWKDEHIPFLKRIATFIKQQGSVSGMQLAHAGRKASRSSPWKGRICLFPGEGGWQTFAPSEVPFYPEQMTPHALQKEEIREIIKAFGNAAERALEAGFEVIELHAAHGYLINQFLSPLSNARTDEYGGSFENRIRFLTEIVKEVRNRIGNKIPLFVRISTIDWVEGGWNLDDSVALSRILKEQSGDVMDCSSGGNSKLQKVTVGPMYQVPFAERIKKETGILVGTVGYITTPVQAESILQEGKADLIIMARQLLREPYLPLHTAHAMGIELPWPNQYLLAKKY